MKRDTSKSICFWSLLRRGVPADTDHSSVVLAFGQKREGGKISCCRVNVTSGELQSHTLSTDIEAFPPHKSDCRKISTADSHLLVVQVF